MICSILLIALLTMQPLFAFDLVEKGHAKVALVLPDKPTRSAEMAALELQSHIFRQTSAELPILHESDLLPKGLKPFYLGETKATMKLSPTLKDQSAYLKVDVDRAILVGLDEKDFGGVDYEKLGAWQGFSSENPKEHLGTLLGAYEILRRYGGIRWYMPTDIGTHIPKRPNFHLPEGEYTFENWTKRRVIGSGNWSEPGSPGKRDLINIVRVTDPLSLRDKNLFALRTRRGGEVFAINHSMRTFYERFGKTHPEWWVDDKPAPEKQLKYDLPAVTEQVIKDANAFFDLPLAERNAGVKGIPWAAGNYWGVMPNDNRDFGTKTHPPLQPWRANPQRYGSGVASNYIFDWVNRVARGVAKTHPEAWISTSAYAGMFEPPEFPMEPNVAVTVAMGDGWDAKSLEILKEWAKISPRISTWEYHYAWGRMFALRPYAIGEYAKTLRDIGLRGMFMEMGDHNSALYHIDYYLMTQALTQNTLDVKKELQEYYVNFYGPSAEPMKKFWETLFEASQRSLTASAPIESWVLADEGDVGKQLKKFIASAKALSKDDPLTLKRVQIIEQGVLDPYLKEVQEARTLASVSLPELKVSTSDAPLNIDGNFDEPIWKTAEESAPFVTLYNKPFPEKTTVRIVREPNALVFGFYCKEPDMKNLVCNHLSSSAGICTDDSVELAITLPFLKSEKDETPHHNQVMQPSGGKEDYLQIMANTAGYTWHWWRGKYPAGEPKDFQIQCATKKLDNAWQLELRVPLDAKKYPIDFSASIRGNFLRNRPRGKDPRVSDENHAAWSPTFSASFHIMNRFGRLIFIHPEKP